MRGFLLGLIVASAGWVGAYYYFVLRVQPAAPAPQVAPMADVPAPKRARRVKRRGRAVAQAPGSEAAVAPAQPERKLTAAELRSVGKGDDLSKPDVLHLDMANGAAEELSQDEIDDRFRARQDAILDCIDKARPDPSTFVPGRVNIQFRIQRTGQIRGVRVEAPAILQQGGLYGCVKEVVSGLHYPASGGSQVVTYPFELS
ncbi:MAG: AgmX/PglI C-terminal domain-containing protein [Deltaproteobacteria bacterium]|nr:AgmX/PglI C-terminal domain-containing protein [Deltaproteobacteria bacterium]